MRDDGPRVVSPADHGPARTGTHVYPDPGLAAGLLGEPVTLQSLAGGSAVLAGVLVVRLSGRSRSRYDSAPGGSP